MAGLRSKPAAPNTPWHCSGTSTPAANETFSAHTAQHQPNQALTRQGFFLVAPGLQIRPLLHRERRRARGPPLGPHRACAPSSPATAQCPAGYSCRGPPRPGWRPTCAPPPACGGDESSCPAAAPAHLFHGEVKHRGQRQCRIERGLPLARLQLRNRRAIFEPRPLRQLRLRQAPLLAQFPQPSRIHPHPLIALPRPLPWCHGCVPLLKAQVCLFFNSR